MPQLLLTVRRNRNFCFYLTVCRTDAFSATTGNNNNEYCQEDKRDYDFSYSHNSFRFIGIKLVKMVNKIKSLTVILHNLSIIFHYISRTNAFVARYQHTDNKGYGDQG